MKAFQEKINKDVSNIHLRCFSHSMALVVTNGLRKCTDVRSIIQKCNNICKKYNNKKEFREFLINKNYNSISKYVKTRWNSQLKTLKSICLIKTDDLNQGLSGCGASKYKIHSQEKIRLLEIVKILNQFAFVTDDLQGF